MKNMYKFLISIEIIMMMLLSMFSLCWADEPDIDDVYDVNKYWRIAEGLYPHPDRDTEDTNDDRMCWAAAAANIITYTNWAVNRSDLGEQGPLEYHVYHDFLSAFPNTGGILKKAVKSYFSWYYPDLNYLDYYISYGSSLADKFPEKIQELIDEKIGLVLNVYWYAGDGTLLGGHAISCWDYETINDENGDSDYVIEYLKVYFTCSDDYAQYHLGDDPITSIWPFYYETKILQNTTVELITIPDAPSHIEGLYAYGGKLLAIEGLKPKPLYMREYYFCKEGLAIYYDQVSPWREDDQSFGDKITYEGQRYFYKDSAQQTFKLSDVPLLERVDESTDPSQKYYVYKYDGYTITDYQLKSWFVGNQQQGEKIIWNTEEYYYDFSIDAGFVMDASDQTFEKKFRNQTIMPVITFDEYNDSLSELEDELDFPIIQPNPVYANSDKYRTDEDTVLIIPASSGVLSNDNIEDISNYASWIDLPPIHGEVTLHADGSFEYTPNPDYFGNDIFSYKLINVTAADIEINVATVIITIDPVNDPPVITIDDEFRGLEGSDVSFYGTAVDVEGDDIEYYWDFNNDGIWDATGESATYSWYDDFTGTITFQAFDEHDASSVKHPTVIIENLPPTANAGVDIEIFSGESITFSGYFTDPGHDSHTVTWDFDDGFYSYGSLSPTHIFYESKTYSVTLTVEDDDGGIGTDSVEVIVHPIELSLNIDPPMLNKKSKGCWITGYIEFLDGHRLEDIDTSTITLNGIKAEEFPISIGDYDENGIPDLMFKINRFSIMQTIYLPFLNIFDLQVRCEFVSGTQFIGYDSILII